uniref:Uncharacterized protein n=1 Tax=Anguilla anguilla TaxID=7936 RepID=A0A0E9WDU9_ANGAN
MCFKNMIMIQLNSLKKKKKGNESGTFYFCIHYQVCFVFPTLSMKLLNLLKLTVWTNSMCGVFAVVSVEGSTLMMAIYCPFAKPNLD